MIAAGLITAAGFVGSGAYLLSQKGESTKKNTQATNQNAENPNKKTTTTPKKTTTTTSDTAEDKRFRKMYFGSRDMPYDPFYDYTDGDVYNNQFEISSMSVGSHQHAHYLTRMRIVAPFVAMQNWVTNNDNFVGISTRGTAGRMKFMIEIFNPSNVPIPVYKVVIDKLYIGGYEYYLYDAGVDIIKISTGERRSTGDWGKDAYIYQRVPAISAKWQPHSFNTTPTLKNILFSLKDKDLVEVNPRALTVAERKLKAMESTNIAPKSSIYSIVTIGGGSVSSAIGYAISPASDFRKLSCEDMINPALNRWESKWIINFQGIVGGGDIRIKGALYKSFEDLSNKQNIKEVNLELKQGYKPDSVPYTIGVNYVGDRPDVLQPSAVPLDVQWADLEAQYPQYFQ